MVIDHKKLLKVLALLFILAIQNLSAYSDYDMDGVEDRYDKCPSTPFSELVNSDGCTVKYLKSPHHFDIIFGLNFSQADYTTMEKTDTISQSLQIDYFYKNFSIELSSSYYDSQSVTYNNRGINDSFIGAYYKIKLNSDVKLRFGMGAIIPTYESEFDNNSADYTSSLNISYLLNDINLFGGYSFTLINDDDVVTDTITILYQNSNSFNIGAGFYPTSKLYISALYSSSDSIYKDIATIETASSYLFYTINTSWFTTLSYAYGISDSASDNYASIRLGYYF